MTNDRKTGLGNSLLLRRTAQPVEPPVEPQEEPVQETPPPEPTPPIEPQPEPTVETAMVAPPAAPQTKRTEKLTLRDRCTIYLERGVNEQLHMTSRIEGKERSEIVSEILRKHLPKYRIERET